MRGATILARLPAKSAQDPVLEAANRFAECGDVARVKELIEPLLKLSKKRFFFNLVLKAYANAGDLVGAEAWHLRMEREQVVASGRTYGKLLKCAAKANEARRAELWLWAALRVGFAVDGTQLVSLVDAFARSNDPRRADAWLARMLLVTRGSRGLRGPRGSRDVGARGPELAAQGASLAGWAHVGDLRQSALAATCFSRRQWGNLLEACAKASDAAKASQCFQSGLDAKLKPCSMTYTSLIDAYGRSGEGGQAEKQVLAMIRAGVQLEGIVGTALLNAWAKLEMQRTEAWMKRFHRAQVPLDAIAHTTFISACAAVGDVERAEGSLQEMERRGMQTNVVTYTAVLQAHLNSLETPNTPMR
ncbi:unnamed protein product [Effrenium voratum]|nr:unnamed protein product [Effrenium voratum]